MPRPGEGRHREGKLSAGTSCAAAAGPGRAPGRGRSPARLAGSWHQGRLELAEELFEHIESNRLLDRAGHFEAKRFAQAERRFEHSPVEAADDEHRPAIV